MAKKLTPLGTKLLIQLIGREYLSVKQYETNSDIEPEEQKIYLKKISVSELIKARRTEKPGFVLKDGDDFYYAQIDKNLKFLSQNLLGRKHLCSEACLRLSTAQDKDGGCEKVRNFSNYIERYDWIRLGYESFNTTQDAFVVMRCNHYIRR